MNGSFKMSFPLPTLKRTFLQNLLFAGFYNFELWSMGGMVSEKHPYWFTQSCPQFHVHDHLKSTWQSCRLLLWRNRTQEYDKSIRRTWEIHLTESVPNWRKRLRRWFRLEFWMWILFFIRNTQFMCCRIQICAQDGNHHELSYTTRQTKP